MEVIYKISEIKKIIKQKKSEAKTIGFVPTMGALHDGHLSLIKKSVDEADYTVISIFVNPIQFAIGEDYEKYPRDLKKDIKLAKSVGVDLLFAPDAFDILGDNLLTYVDINKLSDNLCGLNRQGHFRGVCTIVAKLFNIVEPNKAFFGKKDIQQLYIIKKMVQDLNFDIDIVPCPILREKDGLAMSSRNVYLSKDERPDALIIYKSINNAIEIINNGETSSEIVINKIKNMINSKKSAKIDYVKIVNENMEDIIKISKHNILALAVYIGKTRLIDNHIIGEKLCY
ncbi:MAG: pantoate--beta-alanine ligase [Spirochaetes bacterium]|nr:pantoate--beta-alanine ligase [Spirochaetota bacterium]